MRTPFIAALAALGMAACEQPDTTLDEQTPATADHAAGAATNTDANADAAAAAAAADASKVTSVDESVGP